MSIFKSGIYFGISICDISTGEFYSAEIKDNQNFPLLLDELARYNPSELVINTMMSESKEEISKIKERFDCYITNYEDKYLNDKLDKLGFDEYFYSSILINNPSIQYRKIQNTYLMKKGEEQFELSDFLIYIMGKLRKIDIYDLCDYIKTQYGLDINRYKIVAITKECSLYYNQITEKVYIDYDEFYNEI